MLSKNVIFCVQERRYVIAFKLKYFVFKNVVM